MSVEITVVTYVHEAHKKWLPFWAEQISKQELKDFNVLFIAHNWGEKDSLAQQMENYFYVEGICDKIWDTQWMCDNFEMQSYWSPPVIGDVIDFAARKVTTEFMAHWDVDDILHPRRLLLQSEFLDVHPEIDFLGTRMVGFCGDPDPAMLKMDYAEPNEPNLHVTDNEQIKACLLGRGENCLGQTTMIYRPETMLSLGGFSRSDVKLDGKSPDFETWKKALMAGYKFHRLPQLCALWRLDSSSIRW